MQEYNQWIQQSNLNGLNNSNLWTASVLLFSQIVFHSEQDSCLPQFKTRLNVKNILNLIEEMNTAITCAEDKDVVFILGSTGSGKSTTINFLMGREMELKHIVQTVILKGYGPTEKEVERISTKDEVQDFKIGHQKVSQTLFLNAVELENTNLIICDSPGFKDSRGVEVEIANSVCLTQFIKKCRSIIPILTININDVRATKGQPFKDVLIMISDFIVSESMENIIFFFTHVSEGCTITEIKNEIIDIYDALYENGSPQLQELLKTLIKSFTQNKVYIVRPLIDSPSVYIKMIKEQQYIQDTMQSFKVNISEKIKSDIDQHSCELYSFVQECTKRFLLESITPVLDQYLQLKNAINISNMEDVYNKSVNYVIKLVTFTKNTAYKNLLSSIEGNNIIDEKSIAKMKKCISCLTKLDKNKHPHFIKCELSEELIINQIIEIIQRLKGQTDINNLKQTQSNIIKIQQLSLLSSKLSHFKDQIEQYVKEKFNLYEQENNNSLIKIFEETKDIDTLDSEIENISNNLKYYQDIESDLSPYLNGVNRYCEEYKTKLFKIVEESFQRISREVRSLHQKVVRRDINLGMIVLPFFSSKTSVFDLQVLKKVSENKGLSDNIKNSNRYQELINDMQELSVCILQNLIDSSKKKKELQQFATALLTLDSIRNLDSGVQKATEKDYWNLISSIKNTIYDAKKEIKLIIKSISSDQKQFSQSSQFSKSSTQNKQNKDLEKLKKYIQFFYNISWIDEKMRTRCVQSTKESMKKSVSKYFVYCLNSCEDFARTKEYQNLKIFLGCLENLSVLKEIIEQFDEKYNNCLSLISEQIRDYLTSIEVQVIKLNQDNILPTKEQLKQINNYILEKNQIKEIKSMSIEIKYEVEKYLNNIFNDFEKEVDSHQTFEQVKNFINNNLQDRKGIQYWVQFVNVIDICNNECRFIKETIEISIGQRIIEKIQKIFKTLIDKYLELNNNSENNSKYLQDLTESYNVLEAFTLGLSSSDSLSYMKTHFSSVPNSKQVVRQSIKILQKDIAQKKFDDVNLRMEQLKLVQCDNQYEINILKLKEYQRNIILDLENNNNHKHNKGGSFNLFSLRNNLQSLKQISEIINDTKCYQHQLEQLFLRHFKEKEFIMTALIKNLQFSEIEDQLEQIEQTVEILQEFNQLFQDNFIKTQVNTQSIVERLQQQIKELHLSYPEKKLVKLYKNIKKEIYYPSLFYDCRQCFIDYQITIVQHIIEYSHLETEQIQALLTQPNKVSRELKIVSKRLNSLEQFVQKLLSLKQIEQIKQIEQNEQIEEIEEIEEDLIKELASNLNKRIQTFQEQIQKHIQKDFYFQRNFEKDESYEEKNQSLSSLSKTNPFEYKQIVEIIENKILESGRVILDAYPKIDPEHLSQIIDLLNFDSHFNVSTQSELQYIFQEIEKKINEFLKDYQKNIQLIVNSPMNDLFVKFLNHYHSIISLTVINYFKGSKIKDQFEKIILEQTNYLLNIQEKQQPLLDKNYKYNHSQMKQIYQKTTQTNHFICGISQIYQSLFKDQQYLIDVFQSIYNLDQLKNLVKSYFQSILTLINENFKQYNLKEMKDNVDIIKQSSQDVNTLFGEDIINYEKMILEVKQDIQGVTLFIMEKISDGQDNTETYTLINLIYELQNIFKDTEKLQINEQIDCIETDLQFLIEQSVLKQISSKIDCNIIFKTVIQQFPPLQGNIEGVITKLIHNTIKQIYQHQRIQ